MIILLQLIAILSIWTLGLTIVTQEGMALYSLREWSNDKGKWVEPLIRCHWCMPSFHSAFAYLFAAGIGVITHFEFKLLAMLPLVIMGASLTNGMIWGLHKLIEAKTKFYSE